MPRDPETGEEWQAAVDAARFCLEVDSARQYGLIETDMQIDATRCLFILEKGRAQGITPGRANRKGPDGKRLQY
jgi:hypothetical protein